MTFCICVHLQLYAVGDSSGTVGVCITVLVLEERHHWGYLLSMIASDHLHVYVECFVPVL